MTQQPHYWVYILRIPQLGIHPEKIIIGKDTCISMFIKTLFIIPRKWISLTDEWIKKLWYIYTMKYYSAIKRNNLN